MKASLIALVVLALCCVALAKKEDVCSKDVQFGDLVLKFANKGNTPSFQYWLDDEDKTKYILSFDSVYAFDNDGNDFKFSKQSLSSWNWELVDCAVDCEVVEDEEDSDETYEQCEFEFRGNNGEATDSADRLDMSVVTEIRNTSGTNKFKFGVDVTGNELVSVFDAANTFQVAFKFIATGSYKIEDDDDEEGTEVSSNGGSSSFEINNNWVSFHGAGKDDCKFQEGDDEAEGDCGLHNFHLNLDAEKKPRLSISWDDASGYERIFFDPVVRADSAGTLVISVATVFLSALFALMW
mgnify:CR=1 FL=1